MLTSIPYEKGWKITVDGEKVEPEKVVNALIGIPMSAGEHVVTMKYTPPGWWMGIVLLNIGIVCIVFIGLYDRKNKKHLIAIYNKNTSYLSNVKTQKSTSKNKRNKKR
jgi:uncharacterized membrane protein YfhO